MGWFTNQLFVFPDKPKVTVTRQASDVLEEGKGTITMTCQADANPPARVFWRKYGGTEESQYVETIDYSPVMTSLWVDFLKEI